MARGKNGINNRRQTTKAGQSGAKNPIKSVLKAGTRGRASKPDAPGSNRNRSNSTGGKRGNNNRPNRSASRNSGDHEKKQQLTVEELNTDMDDYWMKGSNKEVAEKKLSEDMDAYWDKKDQDKGVDSEPTTKETAAENNVEDGTVESKTGDAEADLETEAVETSR